MKIYTKSGDKGRTSLATGKRVSKSDLRLEAYGTADELNSYVGWLRSKMLELSDVWVVRVDSQLVWLQNRLFDLGAILACGLLGLLFYVFRRLILNANNSRDLFVLYAAGGTAALFGIQICFNMLSTLNLFAPKGMTLPFISYGGSSLLAYCLLFGMVLAILREDKWK